MCVYGVTELSGWSSGQRIANRINNQFLCDAIGIGDNLKLVQKDAELLSTSEMDDALRVQLAMRV